MHARRISYSLGNEVIVPLSCRVQKKKEINK